MLEDGKVKQQRLVAALTFDMVFLRNVVGQEI
jgi:hypothetical protein